VTVAARSSVSEGSLLALSPGEYAFYRFGNLAINVWTGQPTGPAVRRLSELTTESRRSCPEGISSVHWIVQGVGLPTPEARAELRQLATRDGDHIACVGVVLNGQGFWASALRSALSGVLLVGPKALFPLRIYGTAEELADWLPVEHVRRTRTYLDRATLLGCIDEVRFAHPSATSPSTSTG
jgi:hypothetical protein